jgi:ribonuclease J
VKEPMEKLGNWIKHKTPSSEAFSSTDGPQSEKSQKSRRTPKKEPRLRIIPLGGLGEIGKNMLALEYDQDIIVIDAGIMFPDETMPGVDLVLPDFTYLVEHRDNVRAILITHGHEDHTGAIPYVLRYLNVPVYAPKFAHGLISAKLRQHRSLKDVALHPISSGTTLKLGVFQVEFFRVCHSIPDAMGISIDTPLGKVIHTGDFKIDHTPVDGVPTDFANLSRIASKGVLLLLSDSTYAEHEGYTPSEKVVSEALDRVIGEATGRVIVATFASLISRVQQVIDASARHNRVVAIMGRSMVDNVKIAQTLNILTVPDGVVRPWEEIKDSLPRDIVIITTGTQGEPTSGLVRIANHNHRDIELLEGDTVVISASPIPGNETLIARTIDNLFRQGANVLHARNERVHVHGHAAQEELKLMLRITQPKYFVPVHGEYRHLVAHAKIARSVGIPSDQTFVIEDGQILELTHSTGTVTEHLSCGNIYVDGSDLWPEDSGIIQERRSMARKGLVVVILPFDEARGLPTKSPTLFSSGFIDSADYADLMSRATKTLDDFLGSHNASYAEWSYLEADIRRILTRFFFDETKRRPFIRIIQS